MFNRRAVISRIGFLAAALTAIGLPAFAREAPEQATGKKYVCPPCNCGADEKEYDAPGACPVCGMPLVEKSAAQPPAAPAKTTSPETPQRQGEAPSEKPGPKPPAPPTPPQ